MNGGVHRREQSDAWANTTASLVSWALLLPFAAILKVYEQYVSKMTYSSEEITKLIVSYTQSGLKMRKFCRENGLSPHALKQWLDGDLPKRKRTKTHGLPQPWYPDIEKELFTWVLQRREEGQAVWRKDMEEYAMQLAAASGQESFTASVGWMTRFMTKNGLVCRKRTKTTRKTDFTDRDFASLL